MTGCTAAPGGRTGIGASPWDGAPGPEAPAPEAPGPAAVGGLEAPGGAVRVIAGWAPAGLVLALVLLLLRRYDTGAADMALFGAHIVLAVALPGTLLFRALTGGARFVAIDIAAGTALGYAVEVLAYIPSRWAGAPRLFLVWPVATVTAFLLVPALRRHWRGSGRRMPLWWSWSVAAIAGWAILAASAEIFHVHGLRAPGDGLPDVHMVFNLALAAEAVHHMPPMVPWVTGEPLSYHWFVYAEMAATHWATGIAPQVLVWRLSALPMMAAFPVLLAAIAHRLTGRRWTGPVALVVCFLTVSPAPAAWTSLLDTSLLSQMNRFVWLSPSQTFGSLLFAALVLVLVDLLRGRVAGPGPWAALCLLTAAVMGAKATFLPMLLCGLVAVAVMEAATSRRPGRPVAAALVLTAACTAFAQLVLFGGAAQGMSVDPGTTLGFVAARTGTSEWLTLLVMSFGGLCVCAGSAGLLRRPAADPAAVLVLTIGISGMAALLAFSSLGLSQFYFARGALPYLVLASVYGAAALLSAPPAGSRRRAERSRHRRPSRRHGLMGGSAAIGVCCAAVVLPAQGSPLPFLAMSAAVAATGLIIAGARLLRPALALTVTVIVLFSLTVPATARQMVRDGRTILSPGRSGYAGTEQISQGGRAAARWLRAHSHPGDLVATNAHCVRPAPARCDNQHLWISALTERRVLVEGWGLTATANSMGTPSGYQFTPFWDRRLLAANDAVFQAPSVAAIDRLGRSYGVRWLFADAHAGELSPELPRYIARRFHRGDCTIYELVP